MDIYYENGCFRLWSAETLDNLPKMTVRKIAKMIGRNRHRTENEECVIAFCEWLCSKVTFYKNKYLENMSDKTAEKQLKFYINLAEVL